MEENNEKETPVEKPVVENKEAEHPKEEQPKVEQPKAEQPEQEIPPRPQMHDERTYQQPRPSEPARHRMHINWELIGKMCVAAIFCGVCGFAGGAIANYTGVGERDDDVPTQEIYSVPGFGFGGGFGMPGQYEEQEPVQDDRDLTDKPVLGVTVRVQADDDGDPEGLSIIAIADESKADEAGLEVGDVITEVDDKDVDDSNDLAAILKDKDVGDHLKITAERGDKEFDVDVELISKASLTSETNRRA